MHITRTGRKIRKRRYEKHRTGSSETERILALLSSIDGIRPRDFEDEDDYEADDEEYEDMEAETEMEIGLESELAAEI